MTVNYDARDHIGVIAKLQGSVWIDVLPWCIWNAAVAMMVWLLKHHKVIDFSFDGGLGYQYISVLVSFFVVSSVNVAYGRFWEARGLLGKALNAAEMLAARAALYSCNETHDKAKAWRNKIKSRLTDLVQTSMRLITDGKATMLNLLGPDNGQEHEKHGLRRSEFIAAVDELLEEDDPHKLAVQLDMAVTEHEKYLDKPLSPNKEMDLLGRTSTFLEAYTGLIKFSSTPRPFVIVQMGRTIVFCWVLFLPFALNSDGERDLLEIIALVFLVTYGFVGLTLAEIEMHDPLGHDPNDLETARYTKILLGDIQHYLGNGFGKSTSFYLPKSDTTYGSTEMTDLESGGTNSSDGF